MGGGRRLGRGVVGRSVFGRGVFGLGLLGLATPLAATTDRPVIALHCDIAAQSGQEVILSAQAQSLCDLAPSIAQSIAPQFQIAQGGDILPSLHVTVTAAGVHNAALAGFWRDDEGVAHALKPLTSTLYDSNSPSILHKGLLRAFLRQFPLFIETQ